MTPSTGKMERSGLPLRLKTQTEKHFFKGPTSDKEHELWHTDGVPHSFSDAVAAEAQQNEYAISFWSLSEPAPAPAPQHGVYPRYEGMRAEAWRILAQVQKGFKEARAVNATNNNPITPESATLVT